uniref:tRNA sulfurtransferase n=1 Tax=Thermofilum pendens TaxID=2269 RepID=A0A7C1T1C0_THEPE
MAYGQAREVILVRLGEATLKGRTRDRFERALLRNIREALRAEGISAPVVRGYGRIYVYAGRESLEPLRRVFGIWSLSPALEVPFKTLDELLEAAESFFKPAVTGKRFAVRARRVGAEGFTSLDVARLLGARLLQYSSGVDLSKPDVTVHVEVRGNKAYLYTEVVPAYGGLPVGTEGRVVALISGGFDSAVAAWYMLKRGAEVHYLFCNLAGDLTKRYVLRVAKVLADRWSYGYRPRLYVVDFRPLISELRRTVDPGVLGVVLKRCMYRAAERVARRVGAYAVVTGESLGQVSSQTLKNLYAIDSAATMPVLRPLIGFDKEEIMRMAREIGVYEESSRVREVCGVFSFHPRTACTLEEVLANESRIAPQLLEKLLAGIEVYDLKSLDPGSLETPDVDIDFVPEGSLVVDVRPPEKYAEWHIPGSINASMEEVLELAGRVAGGRPIVVVCDEGGLSREVAYSLRLLGHSAYSLRGGVRKLREKSKGLRMSSQAG